MQMMAVTTHIFQSFVSILQESKFKLKFPQSLGKLVLVELDKQPQLWCPEDAWFCEKVEVTSPEGPVYKFPIVDWIEDNELHIFREGTGQCQCV